MQFLKGNFNSGIDILKLTQKHTFLCEFYDLSQICCIFLKTGHASSEVTDYINYEHLN
jgi:hypothetical protein